MTNSNLLLSKVWQNFLTRMNSFNSVDPASWKDYHLLGYFCHRFQNHYQRPYALGFNGTAPGKCSEIVIIKKAMAAIGQSSTVVKNYIDWIFDCNIIPNKTVIHKISYLISGGLVNKYLILQSKAKKITKTTPLPSEYTSLIADSNLPIETYGDLAFAQQAVDEAPNDRASYKNLLDQLYSIGLKRETLASL